jgi:hypothetical protein
MLLARKTIGPLDSRTYTIDYSRWLLDGEVLLTVTPSVVPTTDPTFDATAAVDGATITVLVTGGVEDTEYTVSLLITTELSDGNVPSRTQVDCLAFLVVPSCES